MPMIGIDVVAVDRIERALGRWGSRFAARIVGPGEQALWGDQPASVAMCFAVKESVVKALGGWGEHVAWSDIEVHDSHADVPDPVLTALPPSLTGVRSGRWTRADGPSGWWVAGATDGPYVMAIAGA